MCYVLGFMRSLRLRFIYLFPYAANTFLPFSDNVLFPCKPAFLQLTCRSLSLYFFVSLSLSNCIFVQKCSSHDVEECKAFEFKTVYVKKDGMQACRVFLLSKGEMQEG